jgi:hypothetical protein
MKERTQSQQAGLEELELGAPYVRSIVAFALFLRFGPMLTIDNCYRQADEFMKQLKEDIQS